MNIIDLHSHTTASDGALDPIELCLRAKARGVTTLAITDHDTVAAHHFLQQYGVPEGLQLISGIELSTTWSGVEIHVVGLNFPLDHLDLGMIVKVQSDARRARSLHIAERLAKRLPDFNAETIFAEVLQIAMQRQKNSEYGFVLAADKIQIGRPHFARWLMEKGYCHDIEAAFRKYLDQTKIGNLKAFWPKTSQAVAWIRSVGGIAVLAHPARYKMTATKLRALITDFKYAGGHAMEVQGANHPASQIEQMAELCQQFGLLASQGSDFHNPDYAWIDIGQLPSHLPAGLTPVWQHFAS